MAKENQEAQLSLFLMRGIVASMKPEERTKIEKMAEELRTFLKLHGDDAVISLMMVSAEIAAEGKGAANAAAKLFNRD